MKRFSAFLNERIREEVGVIRKDRVLNTFLDLVRLDGPVGGEEPVAAEVVARLETLGCRVTRDAFGNVVAQFAGQGDQVMLINAHLDCVQPCLSIHPVVDGETVRSDGTTVLGADNRAGVAATLEVLASLVEDETRHLPLEIVFTLGEEAGLLGAKALDYSLLRARWGLTLDGAGPVGGCVVSTPWHDVIKATIHGRAAHSGVEPEKGISAILVAAQGIAAMKLGRIDDETTANIGKIAGGTAMNIVAERAELTGEARSRDEEKLKRQTSAMVQALDTAAALAGARVEIQVSRAYNGYNLTDSTPIVSRMVAAARSLGIEPRLEATGGGSDANIFHAHGITILNLCTGYEDAHTVRESIGVGELVRLATLVESIVRC
jgi:tripeptide aminopeptidase